MSYERGAHFRAGDESGMGFVASASLRTLQGLALAAGLLLAQPVAAQTAKTAALPLNIGGRVVAIPGGGYEFGWPGVYFEGRFTGDSVTVAADTGADHLAISVDGRRKAEIIQSGATRLTLEKLGPGEHVVRLDKLTESQTGSARFLGFFVGAGGKALPARQRPHRIEFIGDSHTVGYGVRSSRHECTQEQVHDLTDTSLSFAPALAARLDADYRIVAFSGRGVVRNYNGFSPGEPLPALFPRMIAGQAQPVIGADAWRPEWVVIGLGTNDFSTRLHEGEAWADEAALRADYRNAYVAFIQGLAASRPGARFLLIAGDTFADDVADVAQRSGATAVRITGMDRGACHTHPSAADQQMMADRLEAAIRATP